MRAVQTNQKRERVHTCIRLRLCAGILLLAGVLHCAQSPKEQTDAAAVFAAVGRSAAAPFGEVVAVGRKQEEQWNPAQRRANDKDEEQIFSSEKAEIEGYTTYNATGKE